MLHSIPLDSFSLPQTFTQYKICSCVHLSPDEISQLKPQRYVQHLLPLN